MCNIVIPQTIKNPSRWLKRKAQRSQRRTRLSRPAYHMADIKKQLELISDKVAGINSIAMGEHIAAGHQTETFTPPIDAGRAARACAKRVAKFYWLNDKYRKASGWQKRPDQR